MATRSTRGAGVALTRREYEAAVRRADQAEGSLKEAHSEIRDLKQARQKDRAALNSERVRREYAEQKATGLEAQVKDLQSRAAAPAPAQYDGPTADEPRAMYGAEPEKLKLHFENLAAVKAAQKARPNYWYDSPSEALARWHELQAEEIVDDGAE